MAPEKVSASGEILNRAPSAARALEAARMVPERPQTLPPVSISESDESFTGPRFVIRTMQRDVEAALKQDKSSLGTAVLAEARRRRERSAAGEGSELSRIDPLPAPRRFNIAAFAVIGGIVLVVGALTAIGFVLLRPSGPRETSGTPVASALIPVDGSVSPVTLSGLTTFAIRARLREASQKAKTPINTVFAIPLVDRGQLLPKDKGAILVELTTDEFFRRVVPEVPAALRRALDPSFTFGVHAFNGDTAFLVFGVQSFEIAFAEMFRWERTLTLDLGPVFKRSESQIPRRSEAAPSESDGGVLEGGAIATSSTIGTSTAEESLPQRTLYSGAPRFEDMVIKNYDVRVLRDERGDLVLLYAFANRSTLFITSSIATFEELIRRLTTLKRE